MKPIRIFRHDKWVGAGYFIDTLERLGFSYELIAVDQGEAVTDEFQDASGLVFLGSTASANDPF